MRTPARSPSREPTIIGIDPGASGGVAVLSDGAPPMAWKCPDTERDLFDLLSGIERADGHKFAYIERVGPMPRQGIASTSKFMMHYGGLRMALIALGIPFEAVPPGTWQQAMRCLTKGDKNVSKRRAQEIYPQLKITHSLADALLIAAYGWKQQTGFPYVEKIERYDHPSRGAGAEAR